MTETKPIPLRSREERAAYRRKLQEQRTPEQKAHYQQYHKAWRDKNEQRLNEKRLAQKDYLNALQLKNYHISRSDRIAKRKVYSSKNKEKLRAYARESYQKHRTKRLLACAEYAIRNKDMVRERWNKWAAKNKDKVLKNSAKWRAVHPDVIRTIRDKRRALKNGCDVAGLESIQKWIKRIKSSPCFKCYYCERLISTMDVHFDHVFPLSKQHPHQIDNLCASCSHCNLSKGAKLISKWRTKGQLLFEL